MSEIQLQIPFQFDDGVAKIRTCLSIVFYPNASEYGLSPRLDIFLVGHFLAFFKLLHSMMFMIVEADTGRYPRVGGQMNIWICKRRGKYLILSNRRGGRQDRRRPIVTSLGQIGPSS